MGTRSCPGGCTRDLGTFGIGDIWDWGQHVGTSLRLCHRSGSAGSAAEPLPAPGAASHMFGGAGKGNAEFLLPAPSRSSWYEKPIGALVLGESQTFNSAAAICGEEKSEFGAGCEAGCVWDFGGKGICEPHRGLTALPGRQEGIFGILGAWRCCGGGYSEPGSLQSAGIRIVQAPGAPVQSLLQGWMH